MTMPPESLFVVAATICVAFTAILYYLNCRKCNIILENSAFFIETGRKIL
jgi:hypothetical protein